MDTQNQFTYFLFSILIGLVGGVLYEIFAFFRLLFRCAKGKNKGIAIILDILFGLTFSIFCIFAMFFLQFPAFRGYMGLGFFIGLIIYAKTLRRIVAFFEKVCYNGIARVVKKAKSGKKL